MRVGLRRGLLLVSAVPPVMTGHVVDDYEITQVRMVGARDTFGKARVWIVEPFADGDDEGQWCVLHRSDPWAVFPVKATYAPSFAEALVIARALVVAYEAEARNP